MMSTQLEHEILCYGFMGSWVLDLRQEKIILGMALLANDEWRLDPKLKKYFLKMFDNQSAGCHREREEGPKTQTGNMILF